MKNNIYVKDNHKSIMNFIFGSASGILGTFLLYPTYMLKRVFQANSKFKFKVFLIFLLDDKTLTLSKYIKSVYVTEGITGYYRGLSITLIKTAPYQGLLFFTNEKIKSLMNY